jgi:hypothetical protein
MTDEMRQMRREQVLSTTAKDFAEFGERLKAVAVSVCTRIQPALA